MAANSEAVHTGQSDGGNFAGEGAWDLGAEREGAKGGVLAAMTEVFLLKGAVEPAILSAFEAGRSGLHEVLGIEVGAGHIGRAGGVDNGEMALVVERLEGRQGWVQAEETVKIKDLV